MTTAIGKGTDAPPPPPLSVGVGEPVFEVSVISALASGLSVAEIVRRGTGLLLVIAGIMLFENRRGASATPQQAEIADAYARPPGRPTLRLKSGGMGLRPRLLDLRDAPVGLIRPMNPVFATLGTAAGGSLLRLVFGKVIECLGDRRMERVAVEIQRESKNI